MTSSSGTIEAGWRTAPPIERITALLDTHAAWWSICAATCALLLAPLFLVDVPPLLDYPNHLARMYVLASGVHDPILSSMYEQHWAIIPNLAIDLVMPEMLRLLPIYVAGRVVLGVTLLLPLAGVIVYHRVAFGVRSYWPLAVALAAYNGLFIAGFMNFLLALGMALLAASAWLRWRETHPVWVTLCGVLATVAIFFMHLFGLVFLAVLLGSEELVTHWRLRRTTGARWSHQPRRVLMGVIAFTPPAVLCLMAPLNHVDSVVMYRPLWQKLYGLTEPFLAYDGFVDEATGTIFLAGLYLACRYRQLRFAHGAALALFVLLVAYLACPFVAKGTAFIDARFPIMIGLLLFAGLRPAMLTPRARITIATVLALVFIGRMASVAEVWLDHNRDLADLRQVITAVAPGSRVLVVSVDPQDAPDYWAGVPRGRGGPGSFRLDIHLPALLLIEHKAFFPCLFTVPTKQPLVLRPPYDQLGGIECQPPDWQSLVVGYSVHSIQPEPYLRNWQCNYDYVLLLNAGGAGDLQRFLPDHLALLAATDIAALYRIRPN